MKHRIAVISDTHIFSEDSYADSREEVAVVITDYLDDENVIKITIMRN